MDVQHVKSTFPCSLGARITGVDDKTYSSTGEAFSTVVLPNSDNNCSKKLQADDVSLAYELCVHHAQPVPAPSPMSLVMLLTHVLPSQLQEVPRLHVRGTLSARPHTLVRPLA